MTVMVETECTTCGNRCESRILENHDHLLDPLESYRGDPTSGECYSCGGRVGAKCLEIIPVQKVNGKYERVAE